MAEKLRANQRDLVKAAIIGMLNSGKDLGTDGVPNLPPLNKTLGFDVPKEMRDELYKEIEKEVVTRKNPGKPSVAPEILEAAVQIAAKLLRDGFDVTAESLSADTGIEINGQLADWASKEAKRRSPQLDHDEIVAKAIV